MLRTRSSIALAALALAVGCGGKAPTVKVAAVTEMGALQASPLIVGRDGAYSFQAWGQEVWTFGDTFLSVTNAEGFNFVSNTFATSATQVGSGVLLADRLDDAGAPDELITPSVTELGFDRAHQSTLADGGCPETPCGGRWATWPAATVFDPADGGTALIFYGEITAAPGNFNFSGVGQGIAVWSDFNSLPIRPELDLCPGQPLVLFCEDEPGFGSAAVEIEGQIYAFSCNTSGLSTPCLLGRVPFGSALTKSAWQYWNNGSWTSDLSKASEVFNGSSILGVFFEPADQVWMAIYSEPLANQVVYRTAPAITGPWSSEGNLFVPDLGDAGGGTYDALPHPELSEQNGRVQYVTFSRPAPGGNIFASEFALVQVTFE